MRLPALPSWLSTVRARLLSRRGDHAAALATCGMRDEQVLSKAGMHLSVLRLPARVSAYRALALAATGEFEQAFAMARKLPGGVATRELLGFLAAHLPERTAASLTGHPGLRPVSVFCAARTLSACPRRLDDLPALHGVHAALCAGDNAAAQACFERLYRSTGLEVPASSLASGRLELHSLRCELPPRRRRGLPLVSVILTAHNEQDCLAASVGSILRQDWPRLELLIVDDASTDGTLALAETLAESDERVRVFSSPVQLGTWKAKNRALRAARGAFITMHDADDWSHPSKLSLQMEPLLRDPELLCSSSCFFRVDEETGLPWTRNALSFLRWNPSSLLFRARVLQEIGTYREDLLGADCEFAARIELHGGVASHACVRKPLAIGLLRARSLSSRHRLQEDGLRLRHWEQWRTEHAARWQQARAGTDDRTGQPRSWTT